MSGQAEAQHEAQLRKKPKRIIQNQLVIMALGGIVGVGSMVLAWLTIIFTFSTPNMPIAVFFVWLIGAITYTGVHVAVKYLDKRT